MREISTEIEIHAPAERVWALLTDFGAFPRWNPFIRKIRTVRGEVEEGARLEVFIQPAGGKGMTFRPVLLRVQPPRMLRWRGQLAIPGFFAGEHSFYIEPIRDDRVRFVHREEFRGFLLPLLWRSLDRDTRKGFEEMNRALKSLAEGVA
jgi:hypothetical protein